tara:strand:+ start:1342 stop:1623 length:282 start_codon:yes stop_codon:yes gene_type:complete
MALSRTALFYRKNKASRDKQRKKDVARSVSPEGLKKRKLLKRISKAAIKLGKNIKGKDASHTDSGIVFKSPKANRGSKTDKIGDRRSRGKKYK